MLKTTYRNHLIEEDKDGEGASWFFVYPEGAEDWGMDPLGEFDSLAKAKACVDTIVADRYEERDAAAVYDEQGR